MSEQEQEEQREQEEQAQREQEEQEQREQQERESQERAAEQVQQPSEETTQQVESTSEQTSEQQAEQESQQQSEQAERQAEQTTAQQTEQQVEQVMYRTGSQGQVTIPEVRIQGPPQSVLNDPVKMMQWEAFQDGVNHGQAGSGFKPPVDLDGSNNQRDAYTAGYRWSRGELTLPNQEPSNQSAGPEIRPDDGSGQPYTAEHTPRIEDMLHFLEHGHMPHTEEEQPEIEPEPGHVIPPPPGTPGPTD